MIRIIKTSGKYMGLEIESIEDDAENIETFVKDGIPVIIVDDLSDIDSMDVSFLSGEVEMVE